MRLSTPNYKISVIVSGQYVMVVDESSPNAPVRSATNAAEDICRDLYQRLQRDFVLLYEDTEGNIDQMQHVLGQFKGFRPLNTTDWEVAKKRAVFSESRSEVTLFQRGNRVQHVKTGGVYAIVMLPHEVTIEATGEPAYGYSAVDAQDQCVGPMFVRAQSIMEDGRFIFHHHHPTHNSRRPS